MSCELARSGSLSLTLALSDSLLLYLWLNLSLSLLLIPANSGSLWTLWLSMALSGSLWVSQALIGLKVFARLATSYLRSPSLSHPVKGTFSQIISSSHLIFVNFGPPPQFLGLKNHSCKKRKKIARTESSREEIAQEQYLKICLKIAWNTIKKHVAPPLKIKWCLLIHQICQFLQQNKKKQYLRVHRQRIAQQAWK